MSPAPPFLSRSPARSYTSQAPQWQGCEGDVSTANCIMNVGLQLGRDGPENRRSFVQSVVNLRVNRSEAHKC